MEPKKDKKRTPKINHEEFVKLWKAGVSGKEIAKIMGVADSVVSLYARNHRDECPKRIKKNQIDHEKFVEMWASGASIKQISETLGICEVYVSEYSNQHRDECPMRKPRIKIDHEEFSYLWRLGLSERKIAEKLGVSEMNVSNYVKFHKDEFPRRWKKDRIDHAKFVKMWNEGQTIKDISETFNVSEAFIYTYLKEHREECPKRNGNAKNKRRKISHEEFVKLWNSGYSVLEIAKMLGTTPKYASKYAEKYRELCPRKKSSGRKSKVNHDKFVELWNSNCSIDEIAKVFQTTKTAVSHYAGRHRKECPPRKSGSKKQEK